MTRKIQFTKSFDISTISGGTMNFEHSELYEYNAQTQEIKKIRLTYEYDE